MNGGDSRRSRVHRTRKNASYSLIAKSHIVSSNRQRPTNTFTSAWERKTERELTQARVSAVCSSTISRVIASTLTLVCIHSTTCAYRTSYSPLQYYQLRWKLAPGRLAFQRALQFARSWIPRELLLCTRQFVSTISWSVVIPRWLYFHHRYEILEYAREKLHASLENNNIPPVISITRILLQLQKFYNAMRMQLCCSLR